MYNPIVRTRLQAICDQCYHMYREIEVYFHCSQGCFQSKTLIECAKTLLMDKSEIRKMTDTIG